MKNLADKISDMFVPDQALIFFRNTERANKHVYVELYDIGGEGQPRNGRSLSEAESNKLANLLEISKVSKANFLQPEGLFPLNLLFTNPNRGCAIWYTPKTERNLFFLESLDIPSGSAHVPPLIWKGTDDSLHIYACEDVDRPNAETKLYHAPFFNIDSDGQLCNGDIDIDFSNVVSAEEFMRIWEHNFFNSYFSHMNAHRSSVKKNIIQLWKELINSKQEFPMDTLLKNRKTLKEIL